LHRLDYWLNSLQARVKGVPVIIVGTHMDLYNKLYKKKKKKGNFLFPNSVVLNKKTKTIK